MSDRDIPPLPSDLLSLLDAEKSRPTPAPDTQARVLERLAASIGALPHGGGPGGSGGGSGGGHGPGGGHSGPSGSNAPPAPAAPSPAGGLASSMLAHPVALAMSTLVAGGAIGATVDHVVMQHQEAPVLYVDRWHSADAPISPVNSGGPSTPIESLPSAMTAQHVAALPSTFAPQVSQATSAQVAPDRDTDLAGERALLEIARTALGRRDYQASLDSLDRHARKYPHGQLAEEREALAVQSLAGLGRMDDARARATRFYANFPKSMLAPAVDAAVK